MKEQHLERPERKEELEKGCITEVRQGESLKKEKKTGHVQYCPIPGDGAT